MLQVSHDFLHEFASHRNRPVRENLKYSTKNVDAEKFLRESDEYLGIMVNDKAAHGVEFQKCLERTCAVELKSMFPPGGR
jgi:sulfite reductase beta subunit-like hemoprotein